MEKKSTLFIVYTTLFIALATSGILLLFFRFTPNFSENDWLLDLNTLEHVQVTPWGIKRFIDASLINSKFKGKAVKVAVMDSGVDFNHPDFEGKIKPGYNVIHPGELPADDYGHDLCSSW